MSETHQVLLNIIHALLPHREFISGQIELRQLSEYARLVEHFESKIDWRLINEALQKEKLANWCATYQYLAYQLMDTPLPIGFKTNIFNKLHAKRIIKTSELAAQSVNQKSFETKSLKLLFKCYYLLKMPGWIWTHPCYAEGDNVFIDRLIMLFRKLFNLDAWKKI